MRAFNKFRTFLIQLKQAKNCHKQQILSAKFRENELLSLLDIVSWYFSFNQILTNRLIGFQPEFFNFKMDYEIPLHFRMLENVQ